MWEPFTDSAHEAIVHAYEEAAGSNMIDVEDILLGILATDGNGGRALSAHGLKLEDARRVGKECRLQEHRPHGKVRDVRQEMIFSPNAKRLIEFDFEQARKLKHNYIGSEHLVLGILQQNAYERSLAIAQLCGDGADIEAEIRRLVATAPQESKERQPAAFWAHRVARSMWEPFAEDARQAIINAQAAAMKAGVPFIASEHLLLGIMTVGSGVGWETLANAGMQSDTLEAIVRKCSREYSVKNTPGEPEYVFAPNAKRVIERAFATAFQMKQEHIGTGHLLIALVDGEDHIERIFAELHIERERIKRSAIERLQPEL